MAKIRFGRIFGIIFGIIYVLLGIFLLIGPISAIKVGGYGESDATITMLVVAVVNLLIGLSLFTWNKLMARITVFSLPLLVLLDVLLNSILGRRFNVLNSIASSYPEITLLMYLPPVLALYFVFKAAFKSNG